MSARAWSGLAWLFVTGAALVYVATRLSVNADFSAFLPSAASANQRLLLAELKEGVASRLLLIELAGDSPERLTETSRRLAQALGAEERFRYVNNGDADLAARDLSVLREYRYHLSDAVAPGRFGADGLRAALAQRLRALAGGAGLFEKMLLPEDPTGETLHVAERLAPATQPRRAHGLWFDASGTRALMLAETRAAGSDLEGQAQVVAVLERAFTAAKAESAAQLRYSSPGAMAVQSRAVIAADASRLAIISTALVVGILGFVYRSPAVVLLCAVPALTGLLIAVATVDAVFGGIHAITLGFGATLLGEAVDYPSYLLTQMRSGESAPVALSRLAPTLAIAVLTTATASAALLLTDFPGLAQLGLLTMVGVLGAGVVTAWILPHWVPSNWRAVPVPSPAKPWIIALPYAARLALAVALVGGLLALAFAKPWWDDDLANMNPLPTSLKQRDRELRAALGAPEVRYSLLVDGGTREEALERVENLRPALEQAVASRSLGGFELVSSFLPPEATQRRRLAALPDPVRLRENFVEAARDLPIRLQAFEPFFVAVGEARTGKLLDASGLAGTALGLKLDGLLRRDGARWVAVVPLSGVDNADEVRALVQRARVPAVEFIDLQAISREMIGAFRVNALRAFAGGALLIFAVLAVGSRGVRPAARVAFPVAVGVVATAAALVALGQPLTVFHLVALMLVAGIGTNYALFLARGAAAAEPHREIARSLGVVAGTTLCAFGTLATSQTQVLRAIGLTITLGVVLTLAISVLLIARRPSPGPVV